jgi:predicted HicB family RNase H-like nuclease
MSTQLNYKKYTAQFTVDMQTGMICGNVLDINDVLAFEGQTVADAIKEFHRTVDAYLDFCDRKGVEAEKPFSGRLLFRTKTPEDHRQIYLAATKDGKTINAWLQEVIRKAAEHTLTKGAIAPESESVVPVSFSGDSGLINTNDLDFVDALYPSVRELLKSSSFSALLQFGEAARSLRNGVEQLQPCLKNPTSDSVLHVVQQLMNAMQTTSASAAMNSDVLNQH